MTKLSRKKRGKFVTYNKLVESLRKISDKKGNISLDVLKSVTELAIELAREGREGRKIGAIFIVGDEQNVLEHSHPLILDPLAGHPPDIKRIDDVGMRETVKEISQLDGAFIISHDGIVLSATRYLDAQKNNIELPLGLGSRHVAAASISTNTDAVAVVVSESSIVRIIMDGKIIAEIIPELWLFHQERTTISDAVVETITEQNIAVISKTD